MNTNWLKARQTKYTGYVTLYIVVILAVLAAVNFLANRHNKSHDTTANKIYSLSDQTEKIVKGLETDAKITVYDQTSRFAQAQDLLDRYENMSPKLSVEYVDPDKKPQLARAAGISTYGTIYVEVAGKREEAKAVQEQDITNALIRALKGGERMVCAVQGSGEHSFDNSERSGYSSLKEVLENNNYTTQTISLLENPSVPSACNVLLVGGPRFDYVEPVVDAIEDYVEGGGRALLMIDPPVRFGEDSVGSNQAMVKMLEGWGVKLAEDLVLDTSGIGGLFGLGPEVPLVTDYDTHAIVDDLREVATAFPLVRTLETTSVDGVTVDTLFSASSNSYATEKLASAEIEINPSEDKKGPFHLAAAGTVTVSEEEDSEEAEEPAAEEDDAEDTEVDEDAPEAEGRFVVVGSSGWVANNILRFNGNRDLVLNMMNWLSSDEDLISIRPKEPADRRLSLTRQQMSTVFYSTVIFLPLLIIAGGISVWWRRR